MGDTKKTEMAKKEETERSVDFKELRGDLFNEAAKLVSEVPSTRIAIFVTPPPSSDSDGSVHSFAHPSVESVVQTFLEDKSPVPVLEDDDEEEKEDPSSERFWWEDDEQYDSMNAEQLEAAQEKLMRLRNHMILQLEAKERGQCSGNQQDLHKDEEP